MTRRIVCASGLGGLVAAVATPVMGQALSHAYGPHNRQTLRFVRGQANGPRPLVVMVGGTRPVPLRQARLLVSRGMSVALMDRRLERHGFQAHTSDIARAMAYLVARKDRLELGEGLALWGEGTGAQAVALTLKDRRYLSAAGLHPRSVWGAVLLSQMPVRDATFTVAEAYGSGEPAALLHTKKATEGAAFLSGLLG